MTLMRTIGYVQFSPVFGEREANFAAIERLCAQASGAQLLVLPELGAVGYEFRTREEALGLAEPFGAGPTAAFLARQAARLACTLVLGYPERDGDRAYNACMLATPDGRLHNYRKIHLFSRETELFDAGDRVPPVVETPAGRVGLMICFDWFFPETARLLALGGAQILAHPSNLVLAFCQKAMYARSVENRVYSVTANRIGTETRAGRELTFTGGSQVLDVQGNVLASAPAAEESVGVAEVDVSAADDKQVTPYNHLLRCRRPELYRELAV